MFSYFENRKTTYFDVFFLNFSVETKIKTLFQISYFNLSKKTKWHFGTRIVLPYIILSVACFFLLVDIIFYLLLINFSQKVDSFRFLHLTFFSLSMSCQFFTTSCLFLIIFSLTFSRGFSIFAYFLLCLFVASFFICFLFL